MLKKKQAPAAAAQGSTENHAPPPSSGGGRYPVKSQRPGRAFEARVLQRSVCTLWYASQLTVIVYNHKPSQICQNHTRTLEVLRGLPSKY